jgi:hypothetical protein
MVLMGLDDGTRLGKVQGWRKRPSKTFVLGFDLIDRSM